MIQLSLNLVHLWNILTIRSVCPWKLRSFMLFFYISCVLNPFVVLYCPLLLSAVELCIYKMDGFLCDANVANVNHWLTTTAANCTLQLICNIIY